MKQAVSIDQSTCTLRNRGPSKAGHSASKFNILNRVKLVFRGSAVLGRVDFIYKLGWDYPSCLAFARRSLAIAANSEKDSRPYESTDYSYVCLEESGQPPGQI
jgi:hypothetical protein